MKRFISIFLLLTLLLTSCASGGRETASTDSSEDGTSGTPPVTSEGGSYTPDASHPYAELFYAPTTEYRWNQIVHTLVTNHKGSYAFGSTLKAMSIRGQGGYVTNIPWNDSYVDDLSAFDDLTNAAKDIFDAGLNLWLYDELGYPSGSAGGRTAKDNPEYAAQGLVLIKRSGSGNNPVTVNKDNDLIRLYSAYAIDASGNTVTVPVTDESVTFNGVSGEWTLYVFALMDNFKGSHAQNSAWGCKQWVSNTYINLMDKNAVRAFINNTYVPYAERFEYFDKISGIFTDEPSLMEVYQNTNGLPFKYARASWVEGFEEKFEEMHGYSLSHKLHLLFESDSDEAKLVRVNYRQTVGELVSENYFAQLNDYCVEHGSVLSGHLLLEEGVAHHAYYYGDLMQCVRAMGIAGVDSLMGNDVAFMDIGNPWFMAVKYATSATTLEGKDRLTMVELCATDFENSPFTDKQMRKIFNTLNLMYFSGITTINSYVAIESLHPHQRTVTDYLARLGVISRQAVWDGEIALYYPINTYQAYSTPGNSEGVRKPPSNIIAQVGKEIYEEQLDFTVADNEFILEAEIKDGTLTNGHVSFKSICMPGIEVMPLEVLKKLIEFEKAGGTVIWISTIPTLPDDPKDTAEFKALASTLKKTTLRQAMKDLRSVSGYEVTKAHSKMYIGKYTLDSRPMYWIFNYQDKEGSATVSVKGAKGYELYDPLTGTVTYVEGESITVDVIANNAMFVVADV